MNVPLLDATRRWHCTLCGQIHVTQQAGLIVPTHSCPALGGLSVPFLDDAVKSRLVVKDREDYVGKEIVQTDGNGRPVMSIVTERADGSNDCTVYAPTATAASDVN